MSRKPRRRGQPTLAHPTIATMFAAGGVSASFGPGEVKALHWPDIDLQSRPMKMWRQMADSQP